MKGTKRIRGEAIARMRSLPLFGGCDEPTLEHIARSCTELTFPADSTLIEEHRPGSEFLVMTQGVATASIGGRPVATVGPGDFFGAGSGAARSTRGVTITAKTAVRALVFDPRQFAQLLDAAPGVAREVVSALASPRRWRDG